MASALVDSDHTLANSGHRQGYFGPLSPTPTHYQKHLVGLNTGETAAFASLQYCYLTQKQQTSKFG